MSARQYRPPDAAASLRWLVQAKELCQRLDLPTEAAAFEHFTARIQEGSPIPEASRDEVSSAINGISGLRIINKLGDDYSDRRIAPRTRMSSADILVCGFAGLSSPAPAKQRATGKSPQPAGWKAHATK